MRPVLHRPTAGAVAGPGRSTRTKPARTGPMLGTAVLALALAATLGGCDKNVRHRLDQTRQAIAQNNRAAAMLQVKSLLQAQPDLAEARLLLGTLLLEGGDPLAAEIELRRALELGQSEADVVPLLARALLAANQPARLVMQYGRLSLSDNLVQANLKCAVAEAEATLGDLDAARASLALALRAVPGHAPALLLQARVTAVDGDLPGALAQVGALLAREPGNADGWVLKGDLLARMNGEGPDSRQAYQQALAVKPDHVKAHAALVAHFLARQDADAARVQLEAMRKLLPRHFQTQLFEGQLAFIDGDLQQARESFQELLRVAPEHVVLLQSAGAVELRANALAQAEVLLFKAVQLAPDSVPGRRLLAQCYLAQRQVDRTLATLEPLIGTEHADAEALTLAAQAQLLAGRPAAATALFDRAAQLRPDDPKIRTAVALSRLSQGQTATALAELSAVAAADPGTTADLALVSALLQRKDYAAALQAVDKLQRKQPGLPMAAQLRGQILLLQQDLPAARRAFEQALALDAGYFPAVAALAGLDVLDQKPDAARARLEALVRIRPKHAAARRALAELAARSGASREAVAALFEQGIKANPGDAGLRLALVDHHLATFNPKAAVDAARAALAQLPDNFELLDRLGQAQLQAGQGQQALTTFNRMVTLRGQSPEGPLGLAKVQLAGNDLSAARSSVQRVLALAPSHLAAQRLGIAVALRQKHPDEALALARQVQQQRPELAAGFVLEGEIEIAQKRWDAAIAALRLAVGKADPAQAPARLHQALLRSGRAAEAQAFARTWTQAHPTDVPFLFHLGDEALASKDLPGAEAHYRAVLQVAPEHALSLNNIAWLMLAQNKPGALALAERAVRAAPDRPALLDTLAQALAADNQADEAVATQKRALRIQPDDPALRLNLARYLAQAGDKHQAKAELDRLAALGERFARQDEVAALARSLGGR